MIFFIFLHIASAALLGERTVLTSSAVEGELLRVRYVLNNTFEHEIRNVALFDPSFTRSNVIFVEGKSKAKLTYGTIKSGKAYHVDLDMIPRSPNKIPLLIANATYELPDSSIQTIPLFSEGEINVISKRKSFLNDVKVSQVFYLWLFMCLITIVPILYSFQIRKAKNNLIKSKSS
ncbi:unnamed protein product [Blepharisma stoltei]|uniref:Translocon-associated protein subunit beta n=1 Tax=Blepharisma stoltei TaxID=1481888 RepID=A0AAU9IXS1_9CILI|nr:unnamed protein product [Blepharisma stoltei]